VPFAGRCDGMSEDREHVAPVTLEQRADVAAVARRPCEQFDRLEVDVTRHRLEDLLAARVDEVGPVRPHRSATLAIVSAGTAAPGYDPTADNAACRCSLSQRSASSAAAQPEPAAVTAWR